MRRTSGGAAAQAGTGYENRIAAWVVVRILAGQGSAPPWGLRPGTTLSYVLLQTDRQVDDLLIGTSDGGHAFLQAKHGLKLVASAASELASALDQMIRQYLWKPESGHGERRPCVAGR
jgi:hypothetical protein